MVQWADLARLAKRRPVVRNAAVLALAGSAARLVDAVYRVSVARLTGPETMGLLQMAASVYACALGLATLGLGPAVARLVAARPAEAGNVLATARRLAAPAGLTAAAVLFWSAPWLSRHLLPDTRAAAPLCVLAAALLPAALCGALRGHYQGRQRMAPLLVAQLLEPAVRLAAALTLLPQLPALWSGRPALAPAACLAALAVLGESTECLVLSAAQAREERAFRRSGRRAGVFSRPLAAELLRLSWPVVLGQFLFSLVAVADAMLVPRLLVASGLTPQQATRAYGVLHGLVLPFLFFPLTLVLPVGAVLLPAVAEAGAARDSARLRRRILLAVQAAVAVEAAAALAFLFFPDRLAALVGGGPAVASLLRDLAIWVPFAYVDHVGLAALTGLGRTGAALADSLLNAAVRLSFYCLFIPQPAWRLRGAILSLAAGDAVATAAHFWRLAPATRRRPPRGNPVSPAP